MAPADSLSLTFRGHQELTLLRLWSVAWEKPSLCAFSTAPACRLSQRKIQNILPFVSTAAAWWSREHSPSKKSGEGAEEGQGGRMEQRGSLP